MKLFALTIVLLGIGWAFYGAQPAIAQSPSPANAMASANDPAIGLSMDRHIFDMFFLRSL